MTRDDPSPDKTGLPPTSVPSAVSAGLLALVPPLTLALDPPSRWVAVGVTDFDLTSRYRRTP